VVFFNIIFGSAAKSIKTSPDFAYIANTAEGRLIRQQIEILEGLCMYLILTSIPALILNIIGWLKNGAKCILIAAIIYLLPLNIPSAVLCFICFVKLKKIRNR